MIMKMMQMVLQSGTDNNDSDSDMTRGKLFAPIDERMQKMKRRANKLQLDVPVVEWGNSSLLADLGCI